MSFLAWALVRWVIRRTNNDPAWPCGWRDSGSLLVRACRLVLGASSIPPSKEDDEPKNRDYEEQAEQPGRCRAHARLCGTHAALL